SGIGRGIVLAMAREGADLAIPDIQVVNAEKVAQEVQALGRKAFALKTDVTSATDVKAMIDRTRETLGRIDIVVNNAGIAAPHGVTVNAICPGVLWTSFWEGLAAHLAKTNPAFAGMTARQVFDKRVTDLVPLRREQHPEDIGWAAVFLASEEARNITGQALNV